MRDSFPGAGAAGRTPIRTGGRPISARPQPQIYLLHVDAGGMVWGVGWGGGRGKGVAGEVGRSRFRRD